jgi:hypothetical protein
MHYTYNTILRINLFFQLDAKCVKKYGEWSTCTKTCNGEQKRSVRQEGTGIVRRDIPGLEGKHLFSIFFTCVDSKK